MSNIDKHAVQAVADLKAGYTLGHADVAILNELARIALASLEAEQVGCDACGGNGSVDIDHGEMGIEHIECPKCYAAPPAPVAVPECFKRLLHHAYGMTMGHDWNKVTMAGHHRAKLCQAVDECRAAMLQGADGTLTNEGTMQLSGNSEQIEPVSNRDELPLDYLQGHKDGLEWAAQLAEANHPQTGDWLYDDPIDLARAIRKGPDMPTVQGGNSPVTPDGWISCSERMPEKGQNVLISVNFDSSLVEPLICSARYTGSTFRRGDATIKPGNGIEQATHWMPLPEPPLEAK